MLEGVGGAVDIRNKSGRVEVGGLTGAALTAVHRVEASYGDVVFSWPAQASSLSFTLESSYGNILTDLPATVEKRGSKKSAEGQAGSERPSASVTLSARSGSVRLKQQ